MNSAPSKEDKSQGYEQVSPVSFSTVCTTVSSVILYCCIFRHSVLLYLPSFCTAVSPVILYSLYCCASHHSHPMLVLSPQELYLAQQRLFEMAHVMSEAANSTDQEVYQLHQRVSQLEFENKNLRELLYLADQSVLEPYVGKNGQEHAEKRKSEVEEEDPRLSLSSSRSSKSLTGSIPSPTNPDVFLSPHNSSTDGPFMVDGLLSSPMEDEVNISWPSSEDPPTPANQPSLQVKDQDVSLALQQMDEIFQPWLDEELDGDSPNEDQGELLKDGSHGNIPPSFNCTVRSQTSNSKISPIAVEDIK